MNQEEDEENVRADMVVLKTRAKEYQKDPGGTSSNPISSPPSTKKSTRNNMIKCQDHANEPDNTWTSVNTDCKLCFKFSIVDSLKLQLDYKNEKFVVLPRVGDVLSFLLTKKLNSVGKRNTNNECETSVMVCNQWIFCNVYPASLRTVERKVGILYEEYRAIKKFSKKSQSYWEKCTPFLKKMSELFDVVASKCRREICEEVWNVKMSTKDFDFYAGQTKNPPIGYCENKVDKKWEASMKRKAEDEERLNKPQDASFLCASEEMLAEYDTNVHIETANDEIDFVDDDSDGTTKNENFSTL